MATQHLVLIDALNLIRRIYAVDEAEGRGNIEHALKNARQRVLTASRKIRKTLAPSHGIAVFDGDRSWRYHFEPTYKAARAPMPEALKEALPEFANAFIEAGFTAYRPERDEADDVIASIASKARKHAIDCTIISTDKGFLPLLDEGVAVYDYFKQQAIAKSDVSEKFGLNPKQLCEFWALAGDKTNDIAGVKGIGEKTAKQLLTQYGTIGAALASDELPGKLAVKLLPQLDACAKAKQLVTLRRDIELGFSLRQLRLDAS